MAVLENGEEGIAGLKYPHLPGKQGYRRIAGCKLSYLLKITVNKELFIFPL
jgi:hypothetical protein